MSEIEIKTTAQVTPELLAEFFWGFSDVQQCEFFAALGDITKRDNAYGGGEMQWCYLSDRLKENPKAYEQACSMMAFFFNHTTNYLNNLPAQWVQP